MLLILFNLYSFWIIALHLRQIASLAVIYFKGDNKISRGQKSSQHSGEGLFKIKFAQIVNGRLSLRAHSILYIVI